MTDLINQSIIDFFIINDVKICLKLIQTQSLSNCERYKVLFIDEQNFIKIKLSHNAITSDFYHTSFINGCHVNSSHTDFLISRNQFIFIMDALEIKKYTVIGRSFVLLSSILTNPFIDELNGLSHNRVLAKLSDNLYISSAIPTYRMHDNIFKTVSYIIDILNMTIVDRIDGSLYCEYTGIVNDKIILLMTQNDYILYDFQQNRVINRMPIYSSKYGEFTIINKKLHLSTNRITIFFNYLSF